MNLFVQEFLSQYPKANVRLQYEHPRRVYQLVESDQADVGLVSYPRSSRTITAASWRVEPMVLVCSPRHLLAGRKSISLPELDGIKLVSYDRDLPIRREIDRALMGHGIDAEVVMEFDNIETIKRAIEIDAGVGLLPAPTVVREVEAGSLVAMPLDGDPLVRPLGIVRRRGKELGKTARRLIQLLHEKARRNGAEEFRRSGSSHDSAEDGRTRNPAGRTTVEASAGATTT
jgi:DNA-binding transcriptional LysR family regulator